VENFKARGNKKTEVKNPQLEVDIIALAEPQSQTDPKFQTLFNLKTAVEHIPANKNQHKLDKEN
jgi:hypothetical protein